MKRLCAPCAEVWRLYEQHRGSVGLTQFLDLLIDAVVSSTTATSRGCAEPPCMLAVEVAPTAVKLVRPSTRRNVVLTVALSFTWIALHEHCPEPDGQGSPVLERHLYDAIGVAATMLEVWAFF